MLHEQGVSVFLTRGGKRYAEHEVVHDEVQGTFYRRLDSTKHVHTGAFSTVAISKTKDERDEGVTLFCDFGNSYRMFTATALRVQIFIDQGHQRPKEAAFSIERKDVLKHKWEIGTILPLPSRKAANHRDIAEAGRATSRGCIRVCLTRGHLYGHTEDFDRILGPNGETVCFEFQCRPKGFDFEAAKAQSVSGEELQQPKVLNDTGPPNTQQGAEAGSRARARQDEEVARDARDDSASVKATPQSVASSMEIESAPQPAARSRDDTDLPVSLPGPQPLCRKRKASDDMTRAEGVAKDYLSKAASMAATPMTPAGRIAKLGKLLAEAHEQARPSDIPQSQQLSIPPTPPIPEPMIQGPQDVKMSQVIDLTDDDVEVKQENADETEQRTNEPTAIEEDEDEEDLELELKRIEIKQKLKAMRKKNGKQVLVKAEN